MTIEQIKFIVNIFYPILAFSLGGLAIYTSYRKDKQYLKGIEKEDILREEQIKKTIEQSQVTSKLALSNAQRLDKVEARLEIQEIQARLMLKAELNIMKSLKAHGINGKTDESIREIENYLVNN